jgi:metallo-beta-lactamase family protein
MIGHANRRGQAMTVHLKFLGGVGTVTGSKYLVQSGRKRILVDCGLFQGFKQLRLRNWAPLPVDPAQIDAVVLTHAHLDHSGYLPLLVKQGFKGPIYCTEATRDLCAILLPDSGYLQEKDAEFANRHGFSKHAPALPLYTAEDAERALARFAPIPFRREQHVAKNIAARLLPGGHILGAAVVELRCAKTSIVFSGDLGRPNDATMLEPTTVRRADYLVVESTYGDRRHDPADPENALAEIIIRTAARGGVVLVPAFAVGRTQALLFHLYRLKRDGRIPDLPIFLDSPMAIEASEIFCNHPDDHRLAPDECRAACSVATYTRSVEESKALDQNAVPKVIISASGMATGGRVLHHLKRFAPDRRNTILFSGFQAGGTRGRAMLEGADAVKIHGGQVAVKAEIASLPMLSAHADADEVMAWLRNFAEAPRLTFITHGEPAAADALRLRIETELGWRVVVPDYRDEIDVG